MFSSSVWEGAVPVHTAAAVYLDHFARAVSAKGSHCKLVFPFVITLYLGAA